MYVNGMTEESDVLKFIRERLSSKFDIERMVLFGSRGRGDGGPDSDYDVLVIANSDMPFMQRQRVAATSLGSRDFSVDLLVYTKDEADKASKLLGSALYWAFREGREVYAK